MQHSLNETLSKKHIISKFLGSSSGIFYTPHLRFTLLSTELKKIYRVKYFLISKKCCENTDDNPKIWQLFFFHMKE